MIRDWHGSVQVEELDEGKPFFEEEGKIRADFGQTCKFF